MKNIDLEQYLYNQLGSWGKVEQEMSNLNHSDLIQYLYDELGSWSKAEKMMRKLNGIKK